MISDTTSRKAFSPSIPGLQFAFDSVSLGLLKECGRKYYYTIIEGWIPHQESVHLTFGLHYHKAIEIYEHKKAAGFSHNDSVDASVDYCLTATIVRLPDGRWRPWSSDDPNKNRATLLRSVVWYLEQFEDDAAHTIVLNNGKPAVELSFRFEIPVEVAQQKAMLCGHLDRLVSFNGQVWAMDHKTSKYSLSDDWFSLFNPDNQMSLYTLASQVVYEQPVKGVIISGAQILVNFSRFQRGFTTRHREELDEWMEEAGWYIKLGEAYARKGFWPKNDKSCGHYGGCSFRSICSSAPNVREMLLQASFTRRIWDPLEVRGDI